MKTVGIVPRKGREDLVDLCAELCQRLSAQGLRPLVDEDAGLPGVPTASGLELGLSSDLLVVLGGDGTLLRAAGLSAGREVPILGVNLGRLGFLTEVARDRLYPLLAKALAGQLPISRRLMLQVEVRRGNEVLLAGAALNDAVVSKNAISRLARLELRVEGTVAATYEADGLIVSTPTGSTAYSLSAGGPIVYPTLEAMLLTPICPHALTQRPLVLPADVSLRLKLTSDSEMFVTLDGRVGRALERDMEVWVQRAPHRTLLLRNPEVDPFGILREKLRWGAR